MKEQSRVLGFDDGPFEFNDKKVLTTGVLMRLPNYIEAVLSAEIEVDGRDATDILSECVRTSNYFDQPEAMMIDGIALGGFNVVDLERLWKVTGIPVISVTRNKPDLEAIKAALQKHFGDWEERYALITKNELFQAGDVGNPIFLSVWGMENIDAIKLVRSNTVQGTLPECIRVAHLISRGVSTGESKGSA